ncbi:MAG: type II toxin-antitoxin system mRNA interferase toxin, RelE/StbE family [Bacteroidetes bacterium]|nr:type II toxin-antitoxin system mRNA interferase toxin, RelE/StbE family [Bacteroidota bacterium]MBL7103533.1 type II toxin-antitoxin system mRNA interferase toxin, RelE/StbE family [Bacteroidales bacterium]
MIELIWDEAFIRIIKKWRKKHPDLIKIFEKRILIFIEDPYHPLLKTHRLSGNLKGYWAISITYQYRLVFRFLSQNKVLLIDLGTHDEVY